MTRHAWGWAVTWMGQMTRDAWHRRFEATRADLLDAHRMLDVQARLAAASGPVVFGDAATLRQVERVGVFSGAFNPQTLAHAVVAETARTMQRLDMILWTLTRTTVNKEGVERAVLADRVVQLHAYIRAAGSNDAVVVIDAGLYADQAVVIHSLVGDDGEVWLIVGFDKVVQIFDERYYTHRDAALVRLFGAASLLVAPRGRQGEIDLAELLVKPANRPFAARVSLLPVEPDIAAIASTEARHMMRSEAVPDDLSGLLTPEGTALGLATGAYRDVERLRDGTVVDRYAARMQWLHSMAHTP